MALLEVSHLSVRYPVRGTTGWAGEPRFVHALNDVSFRVDPGETLGLVGESGCGKSSLARAVVQLVSPDAGQIRFNGQDVTHARGRVLAELRRGVQLVFQDPYGSLNPHLDAGTALDEPLRVHTSLGAGDRRVRVSKLLELVGLGPEFAGRFPHELSGGQRQRLGIARALAVGPRLILADEPVASLDVSVRAQIINLLMDLRDQLGLAYLLISHDLGVVTHLSHRTMVMYLGRVLETAPAADLVRRPQHPYTAALLAAAPVPDPEARHRPRDLLTGEVPSPVSPPPGCPFHPRCRYAEPKCRVEVPPLVPQTGEAGEHATACHLMPFASR